MEVQQQRIPGMHLVPPPPQHSWHLWAPMRIALADALLIDVSRLTSLRVVFKANSGCGIPQNVQFVKRLQQHLLQLR